MWFMTLLAYLALAWLTFAVDTGTASQPAVERGAQQYAPEAFTVGGDQVTMLGVEPVEGISSHVATSTDTWTSMGPGEWQPVGQQPGHETLVIDSRDETVLWAGTAMDCYRGGEAPGPLVQSTDGGATWLEAGDPGLVPLASWLNSNLVIAHDCSGLQVSTDAGSTWQVPEGYPLGSQVTAFTVASTPESAEGLSVLVGVTGEGGTSQLYRMSMDGMGAPVVSNPLQTYYGLGSLGVLNDGAILLGAPQGVMRSDDRGETWTTFRGGLESTTLEFDPIEQFPANVEPGSFGLRSMLVTVDDVYVSGVDGIYRWSDEEYSWVLYAPMMAEAELLALEPYGHNILVQSEDGQILRIPGET